MAMECQDKARNAMDYIESLDSDRFDFVKDMLVSYIRIADLQAQNYEALSRELALVRYELERTKAREQVVRNIARLPGRQYI